MSSTPTTKKRTVTDAGLPDDAADVPCCWLCLEEGPDESGKPLVRDCSCRGTSSFAHLSCIVGWAENEGKRMRENEERLVGDNVMRAFTQCPNCKQSYQNDLECNLASAAVDFIEKEFGGIENGELHVSALSIELDTLDAKNTEDIVKAEEICSKLLSLIEEMKNIDEFQRNWESRFLSMETNAYLSAGGFYFQAGAAEENQSAFSKEHLKKAKECFVKARNLCAANGNPDPGAMPCLESALHFIEETLEGGRVELDKEKTMTMARQMYDGSAERIGEGDPVTIQNGINLAVCLGLSNHAIKAERLVAKLAATSHRIHGPDHNITKETISALEKNQERFAYVKSEDLSRFQVLHYTDDGESCVVQGPVPVTHPRNTDEEKQSKIPTLAAIPAEGTPVMCHGLRLQSVSHLNGKIGDVRSHSEDLRRCVVHFEEEGLEPTEVKHENLRILFELPAKK